MNKRLKVIIIIIFILPVIFMIMRIISMEEDAWICKNGQWVKHGVPSTPMPEGKCAWWQNFKPFK
ncbi:MAG: hypothetical protein N2692_02220 [Patescibacteria group bacterium]|jgi:hypothetical protein|nr:hypothetical protein [Patescibacteria group bacterium]